MTAAIDGAESSGGRRGDANPPIFGMSSELQQRRQAALVALGRRAIAPPDVGLLVQDAAALIAETIEADHYGAAELDANGAKLTTRLAATGAGRAGRDRFIENRTKFDKQTSLAAYALQTAQIVNVADLATKSPIHDRFLTGQGLRGALVVPLQMMDQSYGALGAFDRAPRTFTPEDVLFAETIAHLVTTTLSRDRTQKALDDERRLTGAILATVNALVLLLDPSGRISSVNDACARASGFAIQELTARPIWNTLLIHEETRLVQTALDRAANMTAPVECESYVLTKTGERRRVRWNFAAKRSAAGKLEGFVGTGIDITRQRAAEQQLSRLEAAMPTIDAGAGKAERHFRPLPAQPRRERRKRPRRSFDFLQRIAPIVERKIARSAAVQRGPLPRHQLGGIRVRQRESAGTRGIRGRVGHAAGDDLYDRQDHSRHQHHPQRSGPLFGRLRVRRPGDVCRQIHVVAGIIGRADRSSVERQHEEPVQEPAYLPASVAKGGRCQKGVGSRFRHDAGSHYGSFSRRNRLPTPFAASISRRGRCIRKIG